ncbi:hypothetical protein OH77DRAFT_1477486, partial [Trametes cingulata]
MIRAGAKFGVKCDVRNPAKDLREELPVWYHCGSKPGRSTANSTSSRCLRDRHMVMTTKQCAKVAERLTLADTGHKPRASCPCTDCDADRRVRSCDNPHRCALAAKKAIEKLERKWQPDRPGNIDGLTLTRSRRERNQQAQLGGGRVLFDLSITQSAPIAFGFRVFTSDAVGMDCAALRPPRPYHRPEETVEVYTDGSCKENGRAQAQAGSGIWFGHADPRNEGVRVPADEQSNQAAEIYAVTLAEAKVAPFAPLNVVSD